MKVTPKTTKVNTVDYSTLKAGDCFIMHNGVWIVTSNEDLDQGATCLSDGQVLSDLCGQQVLPVDATVTWKAKTKK